jgi:hypothetical protein
MTPGAPKPGEFDDGDEWCEDGVGRDDCGERLV